MAHPEKKRAYRKGHGYMEKPPDLIEATLTMNFQAIEACLDFDPTTIDQLDKLGNNVMHLCVGGGSLRTRPFIEFFLNHTNINLLHTNNEGRTPLELAIAINDELAIELLEGPTHVQLSRARGDPSSDLTPV